MELLYETERLYLKVLDSTWASYVCDFYNRNRDSFEPVEPPRIPNFYTIEFHQANLLQEYDAFIHGGYLRLYLFNKEDPRIIIGSICYNGFKRSCFQSCVVGYKTDRDYRNHGYITEALDYSLHSIIAKEYHFHRVEALVLPENLPSLHVLQRLNFTLEGTARHYAKLNGRWRDHLRYSLLLYQ